MSEYKTERYLAARDAMIRNLPQFCQACPEHLREHGDCAYAGEITALDRCRRIQQEIERMTNEKPHVAAIGVM